MREEECATCFSHWSTSAHSGDLVERKDDLAGATFKMEATNIRMLHVLCCRRGSHT